MQAAFIFQYWDKDFDLANRLVNQLQRFYADSKILAIADGTTRRPWCEVWPDDRRLKRPGLIADYSQRIFDAAASLEADVIVQLDPDCYVQRSIFRWPSAAVAGKTIVLNDEICLHGACWVMSQRAVWEIAAAKPFRLEDYARTTELNGSASEDLGLSRGIKRVIPDTAWGRFNDCWYSRLKGNSQIQPSYAITHPIKNR